ncbi:MAG TPA: tRNA dihydrouridine(20/20a) synthase DusA [Spirochaetia bacterium]|nr:tRNA dihydrouridine(20/20a) synthase DusA [Spirochaetia bacterium]
MYAFDTRRASIRINKPPAISIAPMMDKTDRHYRFFMRNISRRTLLYSEMITAAAIIYGDRDHLLGFSPVEKPLSLQLAGDDPDSLEEAVAIAEAYDYDELNLNCGCPSDKVQDAHIGACLMAEPVLVARLVESMRRASSRPVTVKHRIGIDGQESYEDLRSFVQTVRKAGPDRFTVHARIAILSGLSPKENREIPPLRYEDVYALKAEFPELLIEINGGFTSLDQIARALESVDAVMVGRAAYDNPYLFADVDRLFFGETSMPPTRRQIIEHLIPYVERWEADGLSPHRILRHVLGLFLGQRGSRKWKQLLSPPLVLRMSGGETLCRALEELPDEVLDAQPFAGTAQPFADTAQPFALPAMALPVAESGGRNGG